MIDLHSHSSASDGELSPAQLVAHASLHHVTVLAVSDHDTAAGLSEAKSAAEIHNITLIRGIELNIVYPTGEFHLLGLGLQTVSPQLESIIADLQDDRQTRNHQIVQKMKDDGFDIDMKEIEALAGGACIGRPHVASYLLQKKIVKTRQDAFDKYLGKGRPYYIDRHGAEISQAVEAVLLSGGVPVIAHPLSLYVSWGKMDGVLQSVREAGVLGLEAYHPGARAGECARLEQAGRKAGFFITAGSDFHGQKVRPDRKIGHTAGGKKIDDRFWTEELEPALRSVR